MSCKTTFVASTALALLLAIPALAEDRPAALIISQSGLATKATMTLPMPASNAPRVRPGSRAAPLKARMSWPRPTRSCAVPRMPALGLILDLEYCPWRADRRRRQGLSRHQRIVILNQEVPKGDNIASVVFQRAGRLVSGGCPGGADDHAGTGIEGHQRTAGSGRDRRHQIGGDRQVHRRLHRGCERRSIRPIDVKVAYSNSFRRSRRIGMQMANAMFDEGADIVYHIAGGTGIGVIEAAKEARAFRHRRRYRSGRAGPGPCADLDDQARRRRGGAHVVKDYAADAFKLARTRRFRWVWPQGRWRGPVGDGTHP
jgi:basic membrane protein A